METARGLDALTRAVEQGFVPARGGRALCGEIRNNADFVRLQHKQDAKAENFWKRAPEQQLIDTVLSSAISSSDRFEDSLKIVLERDLERVVAAMAERGLLAPGGDGAALQTLFDRAVLIDGPVDYRRPAPRVARYLLARYPAINPAANDNAAIVASAEHGNVAVIRLLLSDARVDPGARSSYALALSCWHGHTEAARLLFADPRVDPGTLENLAVRWASFRGLAEVIRLLLADSRVDPGTASYNGHTEVVRLLLADARVDPAADDNAAVVKASICGHTEIVRLLLTDPRVDPTAGGDKAIMEAHRIGNAEVVRLLLADGRAKLP